MKQVNFFIIATLICFISCTPQKQQHLTDIIKPVNLNTEDTTKILLSDLFYSEHYDIKLLPNNNFNVAFNKEENMITIISLNNFTGLELIPFELNNTTYEIPVKLELKKKYLFTYKPIGKPKVINLFGQFNSWNRQSLPMRDDSGDGVYEISIPLDPGRYEYKFYVDGKELIDPANPVKVSNGMGDFNSVRVIEEDAKDNMFLHILGSEKKENELSLKFYFENTDRSNLVKPESIVALFDNEKFPADNTEITGREITLKLNKEMLEGNHTVRIAVNRMGNCSNIQTIRLHNGAIAGSSDYKTLNDNIIYCIMIDRFFDGDSSNSIPIKHDSLFAKANYEGGDLKGIIDKIDAGYFDSLGVNTLWISPIIDNTNNAYREYPAPHRWYTGYHGYWPVSSTKVEERFGDLNLAENLVKAAHKNGIKILWDYVAHHVHQEDPLFKEHPDWFGKLKLPDGRLNLRLFDEYRLTTWFEPYMPSFDYTDSPEALEYMTNNAVWWLKTTNADGFRHDAVKHVPNKFWRLLTKKIKSEIEIPDNKNIYQIGETFGGIDLIASYVNNGQLNAQFNFNLYDVAIPTFLNQNASFKLLDYQMQKSFRVFGYNNLMGNIMDSHDKIRYMAYADGDLEINDGRASDFAWNNPPKVDYPSSYEKLKLYMAYLLTIPGVPVIYYGDEIGMTGASDPDNRRMMRFGNQLNDYEKRTLREVRKLVNIRKQHPALRYGDFLTLQSDENIYAYLRSDMNERVLTILNKSKDAQKVILTIPSVYSAKNAFDLESSNKYKIDKNNFVIEIPSTGWKILLLN